MLKADDGRLILKKQLSARRVDKAAFDELRIRSVRIDEMRDLDADSFAVHHPMIPAPSARLDRPGAGYRDLTAHTP